MWGPGNPYWELNARLMAQLYIKFLQNLKASKLDAIWQNLLRNAMAEKGGFANADNNNSNSLPMHPK
jgi:hypothetical protein